MANFDWERIFRSANIDFSSTSASISRGYVNVHCPMCGETDTSYHMGVHRSGGWTCFRNSVGHRGRDPRRIVALLLRCSYEEARAIVGEEEVGSYSDFDEAALQFMSTGQTNLLPTLTMPTTFRHLTSPRGRARIYWQYLRSRSLSVSDTIKVANRYDLHYCDHGPWRGRIILPLTIDGTLLSWVGRTVYDTEELRYKNLSHKPEAEIRGSASVRDLLFNFDHATKSSHRVCVLTEGPFDAIRVDWCGRKYGISAVATFGSRISENQLELLDQVRDKCDHLIICGDRNAEANVMDLHSATCDLGTQVIELPRGVEDPGVLTQKQVRELFGKLGIT